MNTVNPIRDSQTVRNILNYLKNKNERDYVLFSLGIYTGLRIRDILKLKISDVKGKNALNIRDNKTNKENKLEFNSELNRVLRDYCKDKDPDDFLIKSRKGYNKPISREQAYKILRAVALKFNLECIGCHSLRKTFGYHLYRVTNKDIAQVQEALKHSDSSYTLRYIGVNQETLNNSVKKLKF